METKKNYGVIFLILICVLVFTTFLSGCKNPKKAVLEDYVSELKLDILEGSGEKHNVCAWFGYYETPFTVDGAVLNRTPVLTFKAVDKKDNNVTTAISFNIGSIEYRDEFSFDPVKNCYLAKFTIEDFAEKSLQVKITEGAENDTVLLKSIVPSNTVSYRVALDNIYNSQREMLDGYKVDGKYDFEIILRIVCKDGKPYYYVGILSPSSKLKAFLVDGFSGELLAVRQVF